MSIAPPPPNPLQPIQPEAVQPKAAPPQPAPPQPAAPAKASRRVAVNAAAIAASTMLARGIQFGWVLALGRLLAPADFGVYGTIGGMIATAAVIPEFGMGLIVLRDVPQRPAEAGQFLSANLILQPLLAVAAFVLLIIVGLLLPYDAATRLLLSLGALSLFFDALGNIYYSQLIAAEHMIATSLIGITHISLLIAFAFTALIMGGGLAGLYVATISAGALRWLMHWAAARHYGIRATWPAQRSIERRLLRGGWPIMLGNLLRQAYQHVDKVIVLATIGEKEAGYLTAAFVIVFGVTELLNTTVLVAFFPLMSRMAAEAPGQLRRFIDKLALGTLLVGLPLALVIALFARRLSTLLFPGFVDTAAVLEVLIWHTVPVMMGNLYAQLLIIEYRQIVSLGIRGLSLALNIALNLALLPRIGVQGAAVSALVSELCALLLLFLARLRPIASWRIEPARS